MQPITIASVRAHGVRQLLVYQARDGQARAASFPALRLLPAMPATARSSSAISSASLDMCQDLAKVLQVLCPNALFVGSLSGRMASPIPGVWRARRPQGNHAANYFLPHCTCCPYRGP